MPTSPIIKGITTIKWGTTGAVVSGNPGSTVIVESAKFDPNNKEAFIENNDGFDVVWVLLKDGFGVSLVCLYDSALTWPTEGDQIIIKRPSEATSYTCFVRNKPDEQARKKEAMVTIEAFYRPNILS